MRRADWSWHLTRGRYAWSDVVAGWHDARRTPGARVFGGWRIGAADYVLGYAAGVIWVMTAEHVVLAVLLVCHFAGLVALIIADPAGHRGRR